MLSEKRPDFVVINPLLSNFVKETAQCPLVIQQQLLIFLLYLLSHNLNASDLKQAIDMTISPLFATLLSPPPSPQTLLRRSSGFRGSGFNSSTNVVSNSQFTRCAYLVTAMLKVSYSMNHQIREVIYPRLQPAFVMIAQTLCEVCRKNDTSANYENCRILWNFVLYATVILRGRKEEYGQFLPLVASLLEQLPSVLHQLSVSPKSILCICSQDLSCS